jgi:hypothetical protein
VESSKPQTEITLVGGTRVRTPANTDAVIEAWSRREGLMSLEIFNGHGKARPGLIPAMAVIMVVQLR